MRVNRVTSTLLLLFLSASASQLGAQQNEADRTLFEEIKAKAEKGDAGSQFELGTVFGFGKLGVAKDEVEAVKWSRKATEQNNPKAQYNLGVCYCFGQGVSKDYAEGVKWFRKAAEQNVAPAQFNLGVCYEIGEGVSKDYVQGYMWVLLAAAQGFEDAQ